MTTTDGATEPKAGESGAAGLESITGVTFSGVPTGTSVRDGELSAPVIGSTAGGSGNAAISSVSSCGTAVCGASTSVEVSGAGAFGEGGRLATSISGISVSGRSRSAISGASRGLSGSPKGASASAVSVSSGVISSSRRRSTVLPKSAPATGSRSGGGTTDGASGANAVTSGVSEFPPSPSIPGSPSGPPGPPGPPISGARTATSGASSLSGS